MMFFVFFLFQSFPCPEAFSDTQLIPYDHSVNYHLEQIFLPEVMNSHRPFTHRYAARLLENCDQNESCRQHLSAYSRQAIRRYLEERSVCHSTKSGDHRAKLRSSWNNSVRRTLDDNGVGKVRSVYMPLSFWDEELVDSRGWSNRLESTHAFYFSERLFLQISPQLRGEIRQDSSDKFSFQPGASYVSAPLGSYFNIVAGRQPMKWGPGMEAGLMFGGAHRSIDGILLANDQPVQLPSVFRHLGFWRWRVFLGNLGPRQRFDYPWIFTSRFSFKPFERLEISHQQALIFGGSGAPAFQWYEVFLESYTRWKRQSGQVDNNENPADHRLSFDFDFLLSRSFGLYASSGFLIDDWRKGALSSWSHFQDFFKDQVASQHKIRLTGLSKYYFELSYTTIPAIVYRHGRRTEGFTLDGRSLGFPLGSDTKALRFFWRYEHSKNLIFRSATSYQLRSQNRYRQLNLESGGIQRVISIEQSTREKSFAQNVGADWQVREGLYLSSDLGSEFIWDSENQDRFAFNIGVQLRYRL